MLKAAAPYLIEQRYEEYTPEKHELWSELVRRRNEQLSTLACRAYREGYEVIGLREDLLPNLSERSKCTGAELSAPSGNRPISCRAVRKFSPSIWVKCSKRP